GISTGVSPRTASEDRSHRMATNTGKVALVTGAGTGIGRGVSIALAREGYALILTGRRREPLEETAGLLDGAESLVLPADVSDEAAVDALFEGIRERFGRLDLLFNNAGLGAPPV